MEFQASSSASPILEKAAFLPTSLTDVAFGLQRDDSIAVALVMNPRAPLILVNNTSLALIPLTLQWHIICCAFFCVCLSYFISFASSVRERFIFFFFH